MVIRCGEGKLFFNLLVGSQCLECMAGLHPGVVTCTNVSDPLPVVELSPHTT